MRRKQSIARSTPFSARLLFFAALMLMAFPSARVSEIQARWPQHHQSAPGNPEVQSPAAPVRYTRTVGHYDPADVMLVDMNGMKTSLASALNHDGPIILQFIFTTCPTVCPVMSSTLSAAQSKLGVELSKVRMVSISIDPEYDTPERLREYARKFRAGRQWIFLTGNADDVAAVQKAFDAYRGSKMRHEPLTFLRAAQGEPWLRFDGLMSASQLVDEYKLLTAR